MPPGASPAVMVLHLMGAEGTNPAQAVQGSGWLAV